jgi:uncharacterized protein YcfJ
MRIVAASLVVAGSLGLAACAVQPPEGPTVAAMPGHGKTFEQFQADNERCQQVAAQAAGPLTPSQAATQSGVGSAVAGTALGAGAGALVGAAAGGAGVGAAAGAGVGLLAGSAIGANAAQQSAASLQRAYDTAYIQCMSAAGNKVPDLATRPAGYPADDYPAYSYAPPVVGYVYPPPYYYYYGPPVYFGGRWGWGWRRWRY